MNNLVSKLFFAAGVVAYGVFVTSRAQAFGVHEYNTDAVVIPLLGILGHFAFERRAA